MKMISKEIQADLFHQGQSEQVVLSLSASLKRYRAIISRQAKLWNNRYRQRQALSRLSVYELKDVGISRSDAINEASKPFWK